jgi:hypothetical protein
MVLERSMLMSRLQTYFAMKLVCIQSRPSMPQMGTFRSLHAGILCNLEYGTSINPGSFSFASGM